MDFTRKVNRSQYTSEDIPEYPGIYYMYIYEPYQATLYGTV